MDGYNFYAVFGTRGAGSIEYRKLNNVVTEGVYVLASEKTIGTYRYMPNTLSTGSNPALASGITMSTTDGITRLTNDIDDAMLWDLTKAGITDTFYIRPHGSTTVGLGTTASTGENIRISSTYVDNKWAFKTNASYKWQIRNDNATKMYLAVYSDDAWRNYTSASTGQSGKFHLFKQKTVYAFTNYVTTCCSPNTITLASSGSVTGGTFSADVSSACENATVTLTATPAGGYDFTSWTITKTADGSDITSSVSLSGTTSATFTMPDYGVTVNATFTPSGYAITLDKNGGDSDGSAVAAENATAFTDGFTPPSRTGYDVEGYYLEAACETQVAEADGNFIASVEGWTNGSSQFTRNATGKLYANWTAKTSTVTLDNQSATTAGEDEVTATYDAAMRSIAEDLPAKTGHTFRGYYDAVSGGGKKYYNADGSSANNWDKENAEVTLYAYWTPDTTTITLDANGGSGGTTEVLAVYGETPPAITLPTKSGYSFYEYRTGADGSGLQIITTLGNWKNSVTNYTDDGKWVYTADDETTLYAVWKPIYRVEWRVDDIIYRVDSIETGKKVASLPTPPTSLHESSDKNFAGWRDAEIEGSSDTDDTFFDVDHSPSIRADITFHAVFGDKISTSAAKETVLWSEDFSDYNNGAKPENPGETAVVYSQDKEDVTYTYTNGASYDTYVYADGDTKYLTIGGKDGKFAVEDLLTGGATELKLTYDKLENRTVKVYLINDDDDEYMVFLNSQDTYKEGTYSHTFRCDTFTTFTLGFQCTRSNSTAPIDNIVLEVNRPSYEHLVTNSYHSDLTGEGVSPEAMNWSSAAWAKGVVPMISDTVVLSNIAMTVDVNNAKASKVILKDNSTLTISAGKALVVKDNIRKWDGENYVATDEEDIIIGSTLGDGTGALVMGNYDGTNKATVNFAVKAGKKDGKWVNQFIGTPFNDETAVLYNYYGTQLYEFKADGSGTTTSEWTKLTGSSGMTPFMGYNLLSSQNVTSPNPNITLWMQGTLNASSVSTPRVLNGYNNNEADSTENMFANSWMAPIHIDQMETTDFNNMEATIYIFNAGTPEDQDDHSTADGSLDNNSPGQYIVLPIKSATWAGSPTVRVIPAMQAFSVFAKGTSPSLTLDYNKLVYTPALTNVGVVPTRAPKRTTEAKPEVIKLRVAAESGYAANAYLLGREDFNEGFDNGWDGRYLEGDEEAPKLYFPSESGNMVINCVPEIEGSVLNFRRGTKDATYTISFDYNDEQTWYLNDLQEETSTLISKDNTYQFNAAESDSEARFVISKSPIQKTPTGMDTIEEATGARKFLIHSRIYIVRGGRMYDITGKQVQTIH